MANVYAQIRGSKRMILFPPEDVTHLAFAPGSSSSSLDVFSSITTTTTNDNTSKSSTLTTSLTGTHPHSATLWPGDILLLPPMWLHTAEPSPSPSPAAPEAPAAPGTTTRTCSSLPSVAVNVFFRDLDSQRYASGRDVYGNRDLAAYEKGRTEADKLVRGFEGLPGEIRRFYVRRIADEMVQIAEGGG
jgi:tRNA wybutosine-synthesizing protein 4